MQTLSSFFQGKGKQPLYRLVATVLWWAAVVASAAPTFPLKGIVLWPDEARDHPELTDSISLEFSYVTPSSLVKDAPPDGSPAIDWKPLEKLLDDIASRGHQAILRFRYAYPGEKLPEFPGKRGATGVPKYIKALPNYRETFAQNPGGDGPTYYPDWSHPALTDFTMRFFRAFAERYDADPRLAFLEVGFGHWGEYHSHGTEVKLGKNFPSKAFQKSFMEMLSGAMHETPWMVSIDAAQTKYSDLADNPELTALPFGLFAGRVSDTRSYFHSIVSAHLSNEVPRLLTTVSYIMSNCALGLCYVSGRAKSDTLGRAKSDSCQGAKCW